MNKKDMKVGIEERRVIYINFIAQLRREGYVWDAIGYELACVAWALDNLEDASVF